MNTNLMARISSIAFDQRIEEEAKAVIVAEKNGCLFFMTGARLATDIPDRAMRKANACDAQAVADEENASLYWKKWGFKWDVAYMLHNGQIARRGE